MLVAGLTAGVVGGCGGPLPDEDLTAEVRRSGRAATLVDPHTLHRTAAGTVCTDCHSAHGGMMGSALISFGSRAYAPGRPPPSFDIVGKTCSNVACHMVPAGTYDYYFPGGDGEPALQTVTYGGIPVTTPPWPSATSDGCVACHVNPPSPPAGAWHSGFHGGTSSATLNACSLCHPDVTISGGVLALSTATNCGPGGTFGSCAALHRNGVVDVRARFRSSCFGCH